MLRDIAPYRLSYICLGGAVAWPVRDFHHFGKCSPNPLAIFQFSRRQSKAMIPANMHLIRTQKRPSSVLHIQVLVLYTAPLIPSGSVNGRRQRSNQYFIRSRYASRYAFQLLLLLLDLLLQPSKMWSRDRDMDLSTRSRPHRRLP